MTNQTIRVFILDDEESVRIPLAKYLTSTFGYEVQHDADGTRAIEKIIAAEGRFDVVLIDQLLLNGADGIEVMRAIRDRYPDIECIIFTGWGSEHRMRALKTGAFRYIEKPFDLDELAMLIRNAAQQVRLRVISRHILTVRDLPYSLGEISAAARALARGDFAEIELVDPQSGQVNLRTEISDENRAFYHCVRGQDVLSQLVAAGRPMTWNANGSEGTSASVRRKVRSYAAVPIPGETGVLGGLFVYSQDSEHLTEWGTLAMLQTLAGQAGLAARNAEAFEQIRRHARYMEELVKVAQGLTHEQSRKEQISLVWDFVRQQLQVDMFYIAQYDPSVRVLRFLFAYENGQSIPIEDLNLADADTANSVSVHVVRTGEEVSWFTNEEREQLCAALGICPLDTGAPPYPASCFFVPLKLGDAVTGMMSIQSQKQYAFFEDLLDAFRALGSQLAVTLHNVRLLEETKIARERLRGFFEASAELVSSRDPDAILQNTVDRACSAAGAIGASIFLMREKGPIGAIVSSGVDSQVDLRQTIRDQGFSRRVLATGEVAIIEDVSKRLDEVNPSMPARGIGAALCLPVRLEGSRIGVMWLRYDAPRSIPETEVEAAQLYADQAALAYSNARRIRVLEDTRQAAESLAGVADLQDVLGQITQNARSVLQADSAAIWFYDAVRDEFAVENSVCSGIPDDIWQVQLRHEVQRGSTARTVMERGYIAIADVEDRGNTFLGKSTRELLRQIGVKSLQGVRLAVGDERLGVLYINYHHSRDFSQEEEQIVRTFTNYAALALKKARLLEHIRRSRASAQIIAEVSALAELPQTLRTIVEGTRNALDCDIVVLYTYDQDRDTFSFPPVVTGRADPDDETTVVFIDEELMIRRVLDYGKTYVVVDPTSDSITQSSFVVVEGVVSSVAIPFMAGERKVGVMLAHYRRRHRFTQEELADIELFAAQAAVAIYNAQLYALEVRRAAISSALYEAAQAITSSLSRNEILDRIAEQSWCVANRESELRGFSNLALIENSRLVVVSTYPQDRLVALRDVVKEIDINDLVQSGIMGRAVRTGQTQVVGDVRQDRDYILFDEATRSELAVPILMDNTVIGVLNVEHPEVNAFGEFERQALELLTAQVAIAIRNADAYAEVREARGLLGARTALAWMGMASSSWAHTINKHAATIRGEAQLLRDDLRRQLPSSYNQRMQGRTAKIKDLAGQILEKPINAPLSSTEGLNAVPVNALVRERAKQLWQNASYRVVKLSFDLQLPDTMQVWASREWLRQAFDRLVENAIKALEGSDARQVTVVTRLRHQNAEICIVDTGHGIPEDIVAKIGKDKIEKPADAMGLGMGLLQAQTILEAFGGEIYVDSTGSSGTTMVMSLPLYANP